MNVGTGFDLKVFNAIARMRRQVGLATNYSYDAASVTPVAEEVELPQPEVIRDVVGNRIRRS